MPILPKKFPTPVVKPLWPFAAASLIVLYGVNKLQNALMNTQEWRLDPRNPNAAANAKKASAQH